MRRTCRRFALVFALASCLSACGSSDTSVPSQGTGGTGDSNGSYLGGSGSGLGGSVTHTGGYRSTGGAASGTAGDPSASAGADANAGAPGAAVGCDAELVKSAQAVGAAVDALTTLLGQLNQSVAVACANLVTDLGTTTTGAGGGTTLAGTDLEAECDAVVNALSSNHATFVVEGGTCTVDFSAQIDCETTCSGGACADGALDQRCPQGSFMAQCAGCTANGSCLGSAEVPAQCTGTCAGICDGECRGECAVEQNVSGDTCRGLCDGVCHGTCTGTCLLASEQGCGDQVLCRGECAKEPGEGSCSTMPVGPGCELSVECTAACGALAALRSRCVSPTVVVLAATVAETAKPLEAHLPALLSAEQGPGGIALDALAGSGLADLASETAQAIARDPACLGTFGQAVVDKLLSAKKSEEGVAAAVKAASAVHEAVPPAD